MIKIDTSESLSIQEFLNMYYIWVDYQDFYHRPRNCIVEESINGWPCFHYQDIESINKCQSEIIVIDCITEGIHSKNFFDQYNKNNKKYLIISNGWWDKNYHHLPYRYELVHYPYFLLDLANTFLSPHKFNFYIDKHYDFSYPKPCNFISTIGNVRPERSYLVDNLRSRLSYPNYMLRYSGQDLGMACQSDVIDFEPGKFDPYTSIIEKHSHNVSQSLPIEIYNQGYFNLVVESDLDYQAEFFLTEKTVKCLISGIPFVIASTPKFLQHLRDIGFHTYQDLWDESYDDITGFQDRMDKIVELCDHLGNFDWEGNRSRLQHIALKNREVFFKLDKLSSQMFENFEAALLSLDQ